MGQTILMLEHDEDDRYITRAVFDENQHKVDIHFVDSSHELFTYLANSDKANTYPALILLNYHAMPLNAVGILNELKSNTYYTHIPVVILSGSAHQEVIKECYAAGASSFIQKPALHLETKEKISSFVNYWFKTVELP